MNFADRRSFTLIELLVVIAIIAVLAAVVILTLNPGELLKQSRDSNRVSDIDSLNHALNLYLADVSSAVSFGTANTVYVSLPDSSATCANLGLPTLPTGWSYNCVTTSTLRKADSTGWLPMDFTKISSGSPLAFLPIDPNNTTSSGKYYTYTSTSSNQWELTAVMEAQKHDAAINDGGSLPGVFEVGSSLRGLTPATRDMGLVGYWKFDEGSGSTAYDNSGNGGNGNLCTSGTCPGASPPSYVVGKVGPGALSFDGATNYVQTINTSNIPGSGDFSVNFWMKSSGSTSGDHMISNRTGNPSVMIVCGTGIPSVCTFYAYDSVPHTVSVSSNTAVDGTWHMLTGVYSRAGNLTVYTDGLPGSPASLSTIVGTLSMGNFAFGSRPNNGGEFL